MRGSLRAGEGCGAGGAASGAGLRGAGCFRGRAAGAAGLAAAGAWLLLGRMLRIFGVGNQILAILSKICVGTPQYKEGTKTAGQKNSWNSRRPRFLIQPGGNNFKTARGQKPKKLPGAKRPQVWLRPYPKKQPETL